MGHLDMMHAGSKLFLKEEVHGKQMQDLMML